MKPTRFVVAADNHGDMIDDVARNAVLNFIGDYKPDIRIHLGDAFDFRNLRKGASDDEKQASLAADWEMGSDFLRRFFQGGKENHFLRGNHDERLYDLAFSATGVMRDYANDGMKRFDQLIKRCRAKMLPYDSRLGILRIGDMKCVHGYFSGKGSAAAHARVYRNCLFGHTHTIESFSVESDEGQKEARGIGGLCQIDMPYNSRHTAKLRHNNGWAYGVMFEDGSYQLWQATRINNNFYAAKEIQVY
jgi:predicted phosphodiesterase